MKNVIKFIICILIMFIFSTYNLVVMASNKTDLQNEKKELDSSISEAKQELDHLEKEKSATLNAVEKLMSEISGFEEEIDGLEDQISDLKSKITSAEKKIKEDEEEYEKMQLSLQDRLVAMYENGDISYLDVLFSSKNLTDFISSYYLVSEITKYDTEMLKQVEDEKNKIEEEKKDLEDKKKEIDKAKEQKEAKANSLKVVKKEKEAKVNELSEEEKSTQKEIQEMLEDKVQIDKELKKIAEAEAAAAKEAARKAAEAAKNKNQSNSSSNSSSYTGTNTVTPSSAGYIFPVQGCNKSSISSLSYPSYAGHTGVDVNRGVTGKNVVAVKAGTVITSTALKNSNGTYRSYGEYVIISHGDGTMTLYAHMLAGSRTVQAGQTVKQGQVLGIVGSTGNSTGTHLHFEVRTSSTGYKAVNPIPYLP